MVEQAEKNWFMPARELLLTGAGFTSSFGGFLATQMWAAVFNEVEIQSRPNLRNVMLEQLNYETVYDEVLNSRRYTADEQDALAAAFRSAYQKMHQSVLDLGKAGVFRSFVSRFEGRDKEMGFFFTLNQDLFVERFYTSAGSSLIKIPGLQNSKWFNGQLGKHIETDAVQLPGEQHIVDEKAKFWAKSTESFKYVKLHGSCGWKAKDGSDRMVIGHAKTAIILSEPLLRWYLELFEHVLTQPERKLVVIGYGFGDEHINGVVARAIRGAGLRLYVISPKQPAEFKQVLVAGCLPWGNQLWAGLAGYYPGKVTDFYEEAKVGLTSRGQAFFEALKG